MGVKVEDDDEDFELEPRKPGQNQMLFTQNNMEVDKNTCEFLYPQPTIVEGRRMPTLYEVMADDDFLPEFIQNNELLLKM